MDAAQVKALVEAHFGACEITVNGEGANYDIIVVGDVFTGLRAVQKQQLVYGALGEQISSGAIHAVNIATYTPEEWLAR